MLTFFAIGFVIGMLTCIPIGVANVAVIDAAYRHNLARAIAVGLGGAIADGIYSSLGIFGLGPVLEQNPIVPPILYAVSGVVLVIYGVIILRAPPILPAATEAQLPVSRNEHITTGLIVGLLATLLNPSAVVTWVVIVGSYASGVDTYSGIMWVAGIVVGSFAWFVVVAYLADHGKRVLNSNAIWMTRIVAALVAGYGLFSIGRAGKILLSG